MKGGNIFLRLWLNIRLMWNSLFMGMKSADEKTMGVTKDGDATDNSIEEHISEEGLYADLLRGELTQEVIEMRDSNYRGYKGSFDYQYLGNGNSIKKEKNMLSQKLNLFNPDDFKIVLVQDNKLIVDGVVDASQDAEKEGDEVNNNNNTYTLKINRDNFPRFFIEKYIKKIVVREGGNQNIKIDLYCSTYARQFHPTDSLFITEIKNILEKKNKPTDTVIMDSIEFISDGSYGFKDICLFCLGIVNFEGINVYDGNFVLTYTGVPIVWGLDMTEKYRTEEMDKKYANKEMRENAKIFLDSYEKTENNSLNIEEAISLINKLNNES